MVHGLFFLLISKNNYGIFLGTKENNKSLDPLSKLPQGRPVTGMKSNLQQHAQPWNMQQQIKQPGNLIL